MGKGYPEFRSSYSHEELVEHFLLTPAELQLVLTCRGDINRCGMALNSNHSLRSTQSSNPLQTTETTNLRYQTVHDSRFFSPNFTRLNTSQLLHA